ILALKPRRATRSASEQSIGAFDSSWARALEDRSRNDRSRNGRMIKSLKTHVRLCILGNGFRS
ncbi:unnamed protein product, partial [Ilex paraguariensis]